MADFNSTSPELYNQVNYNETPSHYERRLDSFPVVSEKIGRVIIDTENNVATILVSNETKEKTIKLNENLKQDFIRKLRFNTTKEDIKDAIDKGTIKIIEIPGKEKLIISLNGNNIDYIFNLEGTLYFNFKNYLLKDNIKNDLIRRGYSLEVKENIFYFKNKNNYLKPFDEKYINITFDIINENFDFIKTLKEIYDIKDNELK